MKQIQYEQLQPDQYILAYGSQVIGDSKQVFLLKVTSVVEDMGTDSRVVDVLFSMITDSKRECEIKFPKFTTSITKTFDSNYEYFIMTDDEVLRHIVMETI